MVNELFGRIWEKEMTGLLYKLKQDIRNGFVKLSDLRPNSREIAQRMRKNGELFICPKGYFRLNEA
jgi:hypothetical protein